MKRARNQNQNHNQHYQRQRPPHDGRPHQQQPKVSTEQWITSLIVKLGDEQAHKAPNQLRDLADALRNDMPEHRFLVRDTIFDATRVLQHKSAVYASIAAILGARDPSFADEIVENTCKELQGALDEHATLSIRGYTRFVVELAKAHLVTARSVCDLLDAYLAVSDEPDGAPLARAEWFAILVLDALVVGGAYLAFAAEERLTAIVERLRGFAEVRSAAARKPPALLLPYGAFTSQASVGEHFDLLFSLVDEAAGAGAWSFPAVPSPAAELNVELCGLIPAPLPPITVPTHSDGCTYPLLRRLRLLEAGAVGLPAAQRTIMEEYCCMIVSSLHASHKDAANALGCLQEIHAVEASAAFVETILSMLLLLPTPRHKPVYYATLLLDLSKKFPPVPRLLVSAINRLFHSLDRLDVELASRLADWLALHISHFGFNLEPFAEQWSALLAPAGDGAVAEGAHARFVRQLLDKTVRLSYLDRVAKVTPAAFEALLPAAPTGHTPWADSGGADPLAALSKELLERLRTKGAADEVCGWLDAEVEPAKQPLLVAHSLLEAGATKSVSHLERLLEKFGWLIAHVTPSPNRRIELVDAVASFWCDSPQRAWLALSRMQKFKQVDAQSIVRWCCSEKGRRGLCDPATWEGLAASIDASVEEFTVCEREYRMMEQRVQEARERRSDDAMRDEGAPPTAGERRLAEKKEAFEKVRREKKTIFTSLFDGICSALDADARATAADPELVERGEDWRLATAAYARAFGRRYAREYSLDAIEMVTEGSNYLAETRSAVFEELHELRAWLL